MDQPSPPAHINYGEALQKSFLFYEAQRSGELPPDSRITWRGDSGTQDGSRVSRDLTGGYHDAGDNIKFAFPLAGALTMLGWGLLEHTDGYIQSNQYDEALDALKWGTDWLLKAHETDSKGTTALWVQVGNADTEYGVWLPPETLGERPAFKIDRQTPGSDVAAEAAASLAAASMVFRPHDAAYADELLDNAKQLYAFADDADLTPSNGKQRGKYSDVLARVAPSVNSTFTEAGQLESYAYYNSWSSYPDELLWGATWIHQAQLDKGIADTTYLSLAEQQYQNTHFNASWTQDWDNKSQGAAILLAQITQKQSYRNDVENWLNRWLPPGSEQRPSDGDAVAYTPGGLAWLTRWGSLRASANTAFLAGIYADTINDPNGKYSQFAQSQVDYMLGDNPQKFSYVVGVGNDYPAQAHHRAASGIIGYGADYDNPSLDNAHILYGALVGGPMAADEISYRDRRTDYVSNEVALDYNAGFTGAVARLYEQYGGSPITDTLLGELPELTYAPHLQVELQGTIQESEVTLYDDGWSDNLSQLNIFLNQSAQLIGHGSRKLDLSFTGSVTPDSGYTVKPETVLQFEFRGAQEGQLQGIGFERDQSLTSADELHFFKLSGSNEFGFNLGTNYIPGSSWQTYTVNVGDFFTGSFRYLTLVHRQSAGDKTAQSEFRNITLFDKHLPQNKPLSTSAFVLTPFQAAIQAYRGQLEGIHGYQTLLSQVRFGHVTGEDILEAAGLDVNASDAHFVETILRNKAF